MAPDKDGRTGGALVRVPELACELGFPRGKKEGELITQSAVANPVGRRRGASGACGTERVRLRLHVGDVHRVVVSRTRSYRFSE